MTIQEFSNEFDILYNNVMSNQAPGLDEYEKSVFLTKAQNEIVKNYFNPKGNKYQEGFDGSQKRQIDFSNLIKNYRVDDSKLLYPRFTTLFTHTELGDTPIPTMDVVCIPWVSKKNYNTGGAEDVFLVINENILVEDTLSDDRRKVLQVIPIRFDEYTRLLSKPYHRPPKNQAWRIITGTEDQSGDYSSPTYCELHIGNTNKFVEYAIRYLRRPDPIILTNLPDGLSIEGGFTQSDCMLDSEIHPEILQRAVELAKAAYVGDLNNTVELGKRSE